MSSSGAPLPAPPAYVEVDNDTNLSSAFEKLSLSKSPSDPSPETCLAQLKLLFAIQGMKEDVGYMDGLWGLWDSRAGPLDQSVQSVEGKMQDQQLQILSQLREKRWALFVARAVERYRAWWRLFGGRPLREDDMMVQNSTAYVEFPGSAGSEGIEWREEMLPPLDVLMVWHTHMLNPRAFLEDCMLAGLRGFWSTGMPWRLINTAITTSFAYNVTPACKTSWAALTGLAWSNADDPLTITLPCPRCTTNLQIPWTTCSNPPGYPFDGIPDLTGTGYGDGMSRLWPHAAGRRGSSHGNLQHRCGTCQTTLNKPLLCVAKFTNDANCLLNPTINRPMPGTLLDLRSGKPPLSPSATSWSASPPATFPNRLLKKRNDNPRMQVTGLVLSSTQPTMNDVREKVEKMVRRNGSGAGSGVYIRKMMARYWDNHSPFALDLCSAIMRQGVFVEKMHKIDWLHSPAARATMERLVAKYHRFFDIMAKYPHSVAVPTLDVDLAWHTHQLSPGAYYQYSVAKTEKFIDHDDKIDEDALSAHIAWTSKTYRDMYGEVYSECTCWYCEAVRTAVINPIGRLLGISTQEQVAENFHASGQARLHPPDKSAHISSHNAVKTAPDLTIAKPRREVVERRIAERHRRRIDESYEKARKRAELKGRTIPPKGEYYTHWGFPYAYYGPYISPVWYTPGLYDGDSPGQMAGCGEGASGACAAGTCGGTVASRGCGSSGAGGGADGGSSGGGCGSGGGSGGGGGCGGGGGGGGGGC
ncbi:hypothetical protein F5144DRAFT_537475 [Chaetomium tenue]|uniref:Uncharacterized protein n=1 Tax=Chaetomium tenue TaxID=1854479 RepID=A0ACB7P9Z0_9PEZI|nr:hypothetical protein F5144DRAFT_537475 [Chaetomium globosum]